MFISYVQDAGRTRLRRGLHLFHEYFHDDTGRGLGASHQTGWTALVTRCMEVLAAASHGDAK